MEGTPYQPIFEYLLQLIVVNITLITRYYEKKNGFGLVVGFNQLLISYIYYQEKRNLI